MSTPCQAASPNLQKLDPLKRVNYTLGLVLGVEEFVQSDTYFLAKHHLENRLLHGYGTCCGLDVVAQTAPILEVQVTPGWALNPRGQEIKVPQLMCVQVSEWIQANLSALQSLFSSSAPASLNLCVVLCYRECKTDVVPIPGQPCTTQSSSTAPSRIADSFELMLCLDDTWSPLSSPLSSPPGSPPNTGGLCLFRPPQLEDDSIRALAALLSEFQVSSTGPFLTLEDVEQLVSDLHKPVGSPPAGPPYHIDAADAPRFLRAAFRTWITEVRPFVCAPQGTGPCCPPAEKCVLLAELAVELNQPGWIATGLTVDDSRRPFVVPTRLLEEMIFAGAAAALGGGS
jgi:hypothetical protein